MNAVADPPTEMLRYGPMANWLKKRGYSEHEIRQLCENGVIRGKKLRPNSRNWYYASQIKRDLFEESKN